MNKITISFGKTNREFYVPYALARSVETMLNHTNSVNTEVDATDYKEIQNLMNFKERYKERNE